MQQFDKAQHATGQSRFIDDVPSPQGMLHAAVYGSPSAHGRLLNLATERAQQTSGVEAILTFDEIPGSGFIGPTVSDEPLFASNEVMYLGQPIAMVVAHTANEARLAVRRLECSIEPLPVITSATEAYREGHLLESTRRLSKGDVEAVWSECDLIVEGSVELGGQEHLYLETQRVRAIPDDNRSIKIYSATQNPTGVQKAVASVLGVPMHFVEVEVQRVGGAFGGKEEQATHWACMAALAAQRLNRPVQLVLNRSDDLLMTGKRHPYSQSYKLGLRGDGKIMAYQVEHLQNSGAFTDLSSAVLGRTILHSTNAYAIDNVSIRATMCRTNLPPSTAFRGFGAPQGMFPLEAAIYQAARQMRVDAAWLQERNLLTNGYTFAYGQTVSNCSLARTWSEAASAFDLPKSRERIRKFNNRNVGLKKGLAMMPVCFGISFTQTFLNQANSIVHVFTDGSVSLSTGGVEMGQGFTSNLVKIAARTLGINSNRVHMNSTNTTRIANSSATAASSTTDLNGNATVIACQQLLTKLKQVLSARLEVPASAIAIHDENVVVNGKPCGLSWCEVVREGYLARTSLTSHGFYAPKALKSLDQDGHGQPILYYACGTGVIEATVDCLRGTYQIDSIKIMHDTGRSLSPEIDRGQIEGGVAQGIGWVTLEELSYNDEGVLLSDDLSTYKVPNADFMPEQIDARFLSTENILNGRLKNKAVGEPPLMYGIAAYFAVKQAIDEFRLQQGVEDKPPYHDHSPLTPERVLLSLYSTGLEPSSQNKRQITPVGKSDLRVLDRHESTN